MDLHKWANELALNLLQDEDTYNLSRFIAKLSGNKYEKERNMFDELTKDHEFMEWIETHPFYGKMWSFKENWRIDSAKYPNNMFSLVMTPTVDITDDERNELIETIKKLEGK